MTAKTPDNADQLVQIKTLLAMIVAGQFGLPGVNPSAAREWAQQSARQILAELREPPLETRSAP
jgi:hypothetical protein